MWVPRAMLTAAFLGLLAAPAHAELTVLNEERLSIQAKWGEDEATGVLSVLNTASQEVAATVDLQAETLKSVACRGNRSAAAKQATRVKVTCSGLEGVDKPVNGQLVVSGAETPAAHAVTIAPALNSTAWAIGLIVGALSVASVLVGSVWRWAVRDDKRKQRFHGRAPGPEWDFTDSWATTLTAVGALLATVLTELAYPDAPRYIDKDTLLALSVLFAAWVVLAPFLFKAARHKDVPVAGSCSTLWGSNRVLLLCCGLTYAAVLGQLAATALLCFEWTGGGAEGWTAVGAGVFIGAAATRYFILTTKHQADTNWAEVKSAAEAPTVIRQREDAPGTVVVPVPSGPLRWRLP
jgi:hypothetical protein